jgi:GDP-4-dehydro-6-deoxy-D-mannose reductase
MTVPSAFVTGIAGFAGSYLAEELVNAGWRVAGSVIPNEPLTNLAAVKDRIVLTTFDILDPQACQEAINRTSPDYIFHLAAVASVGKSFSAERATLRVNVEGTLNLLEAARQKAGLKRFIFVSSADIYGLFSPKTKTLTEDQPLNPVSPYGISKAAAERTALYFHKQYNLPVVVARSFNHSGPRQVDAFVIPSFARQIALIEAGKQDPVLHVGDLSAKRDLSDVRDIVCGYRLLAEKGTPGRVYQLCSGKAVAINSILKGLLKLSAKDIEVRPDPSRMRKSDIPVLRGTHARATRELGFSIRYSIDETLRDTLNYWRDQIRAHEE